MTFLGRELRCHLFLLLLWSGVLGHGGWLVPLRGRDEAHIGQVNPVL
jgi:hypothetical protein